MGEVTRIELTPAAAMASASASLAQQIPTAPASIWRCAMAEHLWDLECGRSARPADVARAGEAPASELEILRKPYTETELARALRKAIDGA